VSRRPLGLLCAVLVAAAALLWWADVAVWFTVSPPGRPVIELTGAEVSAVPGATAVLGLAGVAAVVAAAGVARRLVGLLLAAAAVAVGTVGVAALRGSAAATAALRARPGGDLDDRFVEPAGGAWLAVGGAVLLAAVGLFVLLTRSAPVRLGARDRDDPARPAELDPDRAAWRALDAGHDPTVDGPPGPDGERFDGKRSPPGGRAV
jgi:uncharacterized membrane protein (TIGR02234 family)